jgi:hypothetical protein
LDDFGREKSAFKMRGLTALTILFPTRALKKLAFFAALAKSFPIGKRGDRKIRPAPIIAKDNSIMPKTTQATKPVPAIAAKPVSAKPVAAITAKDILANAAKPVPAKPAKPVSAKPEPTPRAKRAAVSAKLEKRASVKRERATERKPEPTPGQINAWRAWRTMLTQRLRTASAADAKTIRAKISEYDHKLRNHPAAERATTGPRANANGRKATTGQINAWRAWRTMYQRRLGGSTGKRRAAILDRIAQYNAILRKAGFSDKRA